MKPCEDINTFESVSLEKRQILNKWKGKRKLLNESHGRRRSDRSRDYNFKSGSIPHHSYEKNEESGTFGGNDDGTSKDKNNVSRRTYSDYETKFIRNQDSTDIYGYGMVVDNLKFYKSNAGSTANDPQCATSNFTQNPEPPASEDLPSNFPPSNTDISPSNQTSPNPQNQNPNQNHTPPITNPPKVLKMPKPKKSPKKQIQTTRPRDTPDQNPLKNPLPYTDPGSLKSLIGSTAKNSYMEARENIPSTI